MIIQYIDRFFNRPYGVYRYINLYYDIKLYIGMYII